VSVKFPEAALGRVSVVAGVGSGLAIDASLVEAGVEPLAIGSGARSRVAFDRSRSVLARSICCPPSPSWGCAGPRTS